LFLRPEKENPKFQTGPVSSSQVEAQLIRACISDFARDGARQAYLSWLKDEGEVEKAEILQATLTAFETGKLECLTALPVDTSWSRLLGVTLLRALINGCADSDDFHKRKADFLPYLKPALSLEYSPMEAVPEIGSSYLWGQPDLAPADHWPLISECSDTFDGLAELPQDIPCSFVGQIAWKDLGETVLGQDLPNSGGVSVFAFTEVNELGIMETVIRPWAPEGPLERREIDSKYKDDPHGDGTNGPFPAHKIHLTEVLSLPDATDGPFTSVLPGFGWGEPGNDFYFALKDACGENYHGLGGYLAGTSGGDPSPSRDWLRLCVLRVNPDCGVLHFGVPAEDLSSGRLDRVRYVWMDWDG